MRLAVPRVSSKDFTFDAEHNILVTEASTIGDGVLYARLYDDACDTGFEIYSRNTGAVITVVFSHVSHDTEDDDAKVKVYVPTEQSKKRVPKCAGIEVHVLND
jgi:hypothetical protein